LEIPLEISNNPRPQIVSLLTDFGNKDYYVASLKAKIINIDHGLEIIDISHEIEIHDIVKASFFIKNCYKDFPINTIHVVAVNNAYDQEPEIICFQYEGHHFIGPNNGLFSLAFKEIDLNSIKLISKEHCGSDNTNDKISCAVHHILNFGHITKLGNALDNFVQKLEFR